jgi:hypothetical protein
MKNNNHGGTIRKNTVLIILSPHKEQLLALGQAHQFDCQCFNNYTSSGEEGGSAENTPPPPN